MDIPVTRYLDREGSALAYQTFGSGPAELVWVIEPVMNLDLMWVDPFIHANMQQLDRLGRNVWVQRRGTGLSDRLGYVPTVEQQAADVLAVMDEAGFSNAVVGGFLTGCAAAAMVAAMAPERIKGLSLTDPIPQAAVGVRPLVGIADDERDRFVKDVETAVEAWGSGECMRLWAAQFDTQMNRRLMALFERSSMSPNEAAAHFDWALNTDISDVLRTIQVPTSVQSTGVGFMPDAWVAYAAELVPGATFERFAEFPEGTALGQMWAPVIEHARALAYGEQESPITDRFLGTVLFTDLVKSTETLAALGDSRYQELRAAHERALRLSVENAGGELVSVTGDGTLSVFDGPSQAVRCAERIVREARATGVEVRCGVHTGEIQSDGSNITGMTVHIGARVMAAAGAGEVLVSSTVRDLVFGSGLELRPRGSHTLKGVPGKWELHSLQSAGAQKGTVKPDALGQTPVDRAVIGGSRQFPRVYRSVARGINAMQARKARRGAAPR